MPRSLPRVPDDDSTRPCSAHPRCPERARLWRTARAEDPWLVVPLSLPGAHRRCSADCRSWTKARPSARVPRRRVCRSRRIPATVGSWSSDRPDRRRLWRARSDLTRHVRAEEARVPGRACRAEQVGRSVGHVRVVVGKEVRYRDLIVRWCQFDRGRALGAASEVLDISIEDGWIGRRSWVRIGCGGSVWVGIDCSSGAPWVRAERVRGHTLGRQGPGPRHCCIDRRLADVRMGARPPRSQLVTTDVSSTPGW